MKAEPLACKEKAVTARLLPHPAPLPSSGAAEGCVPPREPLTKEPATEQPPRHPGRWGAEGPHLPASPSPHSVSPSPASPGGPAGRGHFGPYPKHRSGTLISSLHDSGHSLCTHVHACVHMPEAPVYQSPRGRGQATAGLPPAEARGSHLPLSLLFLQLRKVS